MEVGLAEPIFNSLAEQEEDDLQGIADDSLRQRHEELERGDHHETPPETLHDDFRSKHGLGGVPVAGSDAEEVFLRKD